jgi:hypothetical protein
MDKKIALSILLSTLIIAGAFMYAGNRKSAIENSGTNAYRGKAKNV